MSFELYEYMYIKLKLVVIEIELSQEFLQITNYLFTETTQKGCLYNSLDS